MSGPQRVVWADGLLMAPPHLQQLDRYHELLLQSRMEALERLSWGVLSLELDSHALGSEQVRLRHFRGVLPDGVVLDLPTDDPGLPASRPIGPHFPHTKGSLEVFLSLPREREGVNNLTRDPGRAARYREGKRRVYDLAASGDPLELSMCEPNLVLLFGDEPREDFVSIKIGEIVRSDNGGLVVSDPYIPPCLRISASPFLMSGLRRLLQTMVTRHKALSEARRHSSDASIEWTAADMTRYLLLSAVNTYIPVLTHMVDAGDVSPRAAYLVLCQLAGQLTTFDANADPTSFPRFVFTDLRSTFEELFARITALLLATISEHFVAVSLAGRDDGMHTGTLEDARIPQCDRFFIAVKTDLPEQQVAAQLPQLSKIASWNDINNILTAATPGAPVEVTYRPPPEIPIRPGLVYFAIATDNAYWRNILVEQNLAVYLPPFFEPSQTKVELMAVPKRKAS